MCTSDSTGRDSTLGLDFEVVVFAGGPRGNVAWQVLRTQNSVAFEYPLQSEVGAFYEQSAQKVTAGPFPAELGSTWEAFRKNERTALLVSEGNICSLYECGSILLKSLILHVYRSQG